MTLKSLSVFTSLGHSETPPLVSAVSTDTGIRDQDARGSALAGLSAASSHAVAPDLDVVLIGCLEAEICF